MTAIQNPAYKPVMAWLERVELESLFDKDSECESKQGHDCTKVAVYRVRGQYCGTSSNVCAARFELHQKRHVLCTHCYGRGQHVQSHDCWTFIPI